MKGRRILAAVFFLPTLASGYIAWLSWRAGDSGKWLFLVFTLFFLALTVMLILPEFRPPPPKPKPETFTGTRFVPHWFMMGAILIVVAIVLVAIIGAVLRR